MNWFSTFHILIELKDGIFDFGRKVGFSWGIRTQNQLLTIRRSAGKPKLQRLLDCEMLLCNTIGRQLIAPDFHKRGWQGNYEFFSGLSYFSTAVMSIRKKVFLTDHVNDGDTIFDNIAANHCTCSSTITTVTNFMAAKRIFWWNLVR